MTTIKLCGKCLSHIYPGCSHSAADCRSKKTLVTNLTSLTKSIGVEDQVASNILREKKDKSNCVSLRTHGAPMNVSFGCEKERVQLSTEECKTIQYNAGISDNQSNVILKELRMKFGRGVVEPHVREAFVEQKTLFADLFSLSAVEMEFKDRELKVAHMVFCNDVCSFVSRVCALRNVCVEDSELKLGLDDGKGFLKLVLCILSKDDTFESAPKRRKRKDGIKKKSLKSAGVRMCFILAAVCCPEKYENLRKIFEATNIGALVESHKMHLSCDLKTTNILLGLGPHSSKRPCAYCEGERGLWDASNSLRTTNGIAEKHQEWVQDGAKKAKLQNYGNCKGTPLVHLEGTILANVPPPPLHLRKE